MIPPTTTTNSGTTTTTMMDDTTNTGHTDSDAPMLYGAPGNALGLPTGDISGPQGDIDTEDESDPKRPRIQEVAEYPSDGYKEGTQVHRVGEIFSPPRVVPVAKLEGLPGGWSLDLTSVDSRGRVWDFDNPKRRKDAWRLIKQTKPDLVIGSPMCTPFCNVLAMSPAYKETDKYKDLLARAKVHLQFCCEIYEYQIRRGAYFLHEHPAGASSWKLPLVQKVASMPGVYITTGHMCAFGMKQRDGLGEGAIKKPTNFMHNCPTMCTHLGRKCPGDHRHIQLLGGRAAAAQVYPRGLCVAVAEALKEQLTADAAQRDRKNKFEQIKKGFATASCRKKGLRQGLELGWLMHLEDYAVEAPITDELLSVTRDGATDDVKGGWLDYDGVVKARDEEMMYVKKHQVYKRVPLKMCYEETGKGPIDTGWVDTNKGTTEEPNLRSRWVGKECNNKPDPELFAPTSPLEGVRLVVSHCASGRRKRRCICIVDVRRAFFYAAAKRRVFVKLPAEDYQPGDEHMCGLLLQSLYGTRDASRNWEEELCGTLRRLGFVKGKASSCVYTHPQLDIAAAVHGDDITMSGSRQDLEWVKREISKVYEIKTQIMGEGADLPKSVKVLNREMAWTPKGITIEADPKHVQLALEALGMQNCSPVTTPSTVEAKESEAQRLEGVLEKRKGKAAAEEKDLASQGHARNAWPTARDRFEGNLQGPSPAQTDFSQRSWPAAETASQEAKEKSRNSSTRSGEGLWVKGGQPDEELLPKGATQYRAVTARLNYLAQDRPDIRYAVSVCCSAMAQPTVRDLERLKRLARYLKHRPRALCLYEWQEQPTALNAWSDSDWAGDKRTRRSTSGACFLSGKHFLKGMAKRQNVVALSTAEAELYASVLTGAEALGIKSLARDLGMSLEVALGIDASATLSLLNREGLGKAKHIEVQHLWMQDAVRRKVLKVFKVGTDVNPADLFTKGLTAERINYLMQMLGYYFL